METEKQGKKIGDPESALTFIFTMISMCIWVEQMGFFDGPVQLAMGVMQLACYVPYLIGAIFFYLRNDTMRGTVFLIFATLFGGIGAFLNVLGGIAEIIGFEICKQIVAIPYFWGAISLIPMIISVWRTASVSTLLCYICAAAFLILMLPASFGILTTTLNNIIGWLNLIVAITGMYSMMKNLLSLKN